MIVRAIVGGQGQGDWDAKNTGVLLIGIANVVYFMNGSFCMAIPFPR